MGGRIRGVNKMAGVKKPRSRVDEQEFSFETTSEEPEELGSVEQEDLESEVMSQLEIGQDLSYELSRQPSLYAYWAFQSARVADALRAASEKVDRIFYEKYDEYKKDNKDSKENECKAYVKADPGYVEAEEERRGFEYQADLLKSALRSLEMKRDMLIQLGSIYKVEMSQTDMHFGEAYHKERVEKATAILKSKALKGGSGK